MADDWFFWLLLVHVGVAGTLLGRFIGSAINNMYNRWHARRMAELNARYRESRSDLP